MTTVLEDGESTEQYFGGSSAGTFMQRLKTAMDARLGMHAAKSNDGGPTLRTAARQGTDVDYTLPARKTADWLTGVYWHYVGPLYPFLDHEKWRCTYEGLFAGTPITADERIFVATLNVIFALSTQLVESLDAEHRDVSSNDYFCKAQELLRFNQCDPGSLEVVQCLLLMSQYLQSTHRPHQMWMVVGNAVRTAQSLGLHLRETSEVANVQRRELLRRLWYGCVLMDR